MNLSRGTYVMYDDTGMIVSIMVGLEADAAQCCHQEGWKYISTDVSPGYDYYYVDQDQLKSKLAFAGILDKTQVKADGNDYITLTSLPIPCTVSVNNKTYEVTDGTAQISFNLPGNYMLSITSVPQLPGTFQVVAQ